MGLPQRFFANAEQDRRAPGSNIQRTRLRYRAGILPVRGGCLGDSDRRQRQPSRRVDGRAQNWRCESQFHDVLRQHLPVQQLPRLRTAGLAGWRQHHQPDQVPLRSGSEHGRLCGPDHVWGRADDQGREPPAALSEANRDVRRGCVFPQASRGHGVVRASVGDGTADGQRNSPRGVEFQRTQSVDAHELHRNGSGGQQLRQPANRPEHRRGAVPAEPELLVLDQPGVLTMTYKTMKAIRLMRIAGAGAAMVVLSACKDLVVPDYNNTSIDDLVNNPTPTKIAQSAQGLLLGTRTGIGEQNGYISLLGILGRESYNFDPADPRFITEMLIGPLDGGSPAFGGNLFGDSYRNIRNANLLLGALDKVVGLSDEQKSAARGFA